MPSGTNSPDRSARTETPTADPMQLLARARQDPMMAAQLVMLQQQAHELLADIIRDIGLALPSAEKNGYGAANAPRTFTVAALKSQARERESANRQKTELAEGLAFGALFNLDNPDWDPFDPASRSEPAPSLLLSLLTMQPAQEDVPAADHPSP